MEDMRARTIVHPVVAASSRTEYEGLWDLIEILEAPSGDDKKSCRKDEE